MSYYIFNVPFMGNRKDSVVKSDAHGQIYLTGGSVPVTLSAGDVKALMLSKIIEETVSAEDLPEMNPIAFAKWLDTTVLVDGVRMGRKPSAWKAPNYQTAEFMLDAKPDLRRLGPTIYSSDYEPKRKSLQLINETSDAE